MKSKNEHEERKVQFLANVFANIAFQTGLTVGEANYVLKTVQSLTYRQIISLSFFCDQLRLNNIKLRDSDYSEDHDSISSETISVLQEIYQLNNLGLVDCHLRRYQNTDGFQNSNLVRGDSKVLLGWDDIEPKMMRPTTLGKKYCDLMDLSEIPEYDLKIIANILREN